MRHIQDDVTYQDNQTANLASGSCDVCLSVSPQPYDFASSDKSYPSFCKNSTILVHSASNDHNIYVPGGCRSIIPKQEGSASCGRGFKTKPAPGSSHPFYFL